jgi:hypothetical protein
MRMNKYNLGLLALVLVVASFGISDAADTQTLRGEYRWDNGGSEVLTAEFKPDGEGQWTVKFGFKFSGDNYDWNGTATGSLEEGEEITGTATWSKSGRNWVFTGTMKDGVLNGTHAEMRGGRESPSGSFELSR